MNKASGGHFDEYQSSCCRSCLKNCNSGAKKFSPEKGKRIKKSDFVGVEYTKIDSFKIYFRKCTYRTTIKNTFIKNALTEQQ